MDEKTFYTTVAERAGLSKEEVADLTRAVLEELAGQAKEKTGEATGNEQLQAEGKADQAGSNVKQAGENIKDVLR